MDQPEEKKKSRRELRRERWETFKRTLPDAIELARPQAKLWALGLVLVLLGRLTGLVLPAAPTLLIDHVIPEKNYTLLYKIIAAVLGATLIGGVASYGLTQTISKAGQRLIAHLRIKIHRHVSRLSVRYYDNRKTGEIVSRVMNDVEGVRNLVGTGMVEFLGGLISASISFAVLLYLNWQMTVTILFFLGAFAAIVIKAFMTLGPIFKERQRLTAEVSGRLTESIGGIRVVKAYNTEEAERSIFAKGVDALLGSVLKTINTISIVALLTTVMIGLLGSAILVVGGQQLMNGGLKPGEFVSYILYLGFMIAPVSSIVMVGTQLSEVFAGLERMKEVLSEKPEDENDEAKAPLPAITGEIRFENVGFEYDPGKPVLHEISFEAQPGTVTAFVGPSGSGKTTLIGLVASFHQPTTGRLLVDGKDLQSVRLHDYREQLGAVLQENFLFAGTIRENIQYARPDATMEEIREAARLAYCLEFIEKFPKGFDTVIGERGVKLSGGQRQRVAIARALLANPRILILDEATSALDSESEAYIQEGLSKLMEGRTTFVIAHRLSTIRHATQILVLEGGRIAERGTHAELLARRGLYHEMYSRQHGVEENLFLAPGEKPAPDAPEAGADDEGERKRRADKISRMLTGE